jgi:nitroreductase
MEIRDVIKGRRSIRKYKPDEIPENVIREIIEDARWAPSGGNTQPWELYVATGESLRKFKEANQRNFLEGVPAASDIAMQQDWPEVMKNRYQALAKSTLASQNIDRKDRQARQQYNADMFSLFEAPGLILFCLDKALSEEYAMLSIGMLLQTVCLLAHNRGLGTCILAASILYPHLARKILSVPESKNVIIGISIGYPDWEAPVNNFKRERAELDEFVSWLK